MNKTSVATGLGGILLMTAFVPASASAAQMATPTGAEIAGHGVRVEANGVTNTVYFDPGGTARIVTDSGREVQGSWAVQNQMLCLTAATGARECWPYQARFQTGQAVVATSDCGVTSRWTPLSTNPMEAPVRQGERG